MPKFPRLAAVTGALVAVGGLVLERRSGRRSLADEPVTEVDAELAGAA